MSDLEAFLRTHHRVIRTAEALRLGMSRAEIAASVRRGEWVREFRGTYHVLPLSETPLLVRCRAALRYAGAGAAISHLTALSLLAGRTAAPPVVQVSVRRRSVCATPGLEVHWVSGHGPLALVRGVASVSPPAAVVGSWSVLDDRDERRAMLCRAVTDLRVSIDSVHAELQRPIRLRDRKGLEHACWLVTLGCHSPLEMRYYEMVEQAFRLPAGHRQRVIVVTSGRVYRVDVLYEQFRVIVELDGEQHRAGADARQADRLRDAELQAMGFLVLRFTWADVTERPEWVAATVRSALGSREFGRAEVANS